MATRESINESLLDVWHFTMFYLYLSIFNFILILDRIWKQESVGWLQNNLKLLYVHSHPGGRLNKKDGLTRCGDSHVKDKTS